MLDWQIGAVFPKRITSFGESGCFHRVVAQFVAVGFMPVAQFAYCSAVIVPASVDNADKPAFYAVSY